MIENYYYFSLFRFPRSINTSFVFLFSQKLSNIVLGSISYQDKKLIDLYEKLKNKFKGCSEMFSYFLVFSIKKKKQRKILLVVRNKFFSHKNKLEMEITSQHYLTHFPTSHKNQLFILSFFNLLSNRTLKYHYIKNTILKPTRYTIQIILSILNLFFSNFIITSE